VPSSPAARAGLEAGSVITGLNGKAVVTYHTLTGLLLQTSPGSPTRIAWLDPDGVRHTATVHTAVGPPQ
jgi:S1-C subfamily serine protease